MDKDARAPLGSGHAKQGNKVVDVAVNAAVGDESHEVQGFARVAGGVHCVHQHGVARQRSIIDGARDADDVHEDHPAGPQGHVAHLGVAHLPLGEPHRLAARVEPAHGERAAHPVEERRVRLRNRVVLVRVAQAEAVQDDQHGERWSHARSRGSRNGPGVRGRGGAWTLPPRGRDRRAGRRTRAFRGCRRRERARGTRARSDRRSR